MEILYKDKNIIAVNKPSGMPSQSDPSGAPDAMTVAREQLRSIGEHSELWLVHRLDRVVAGVLVFARNKRYAAILSEFFATHAAVKEYLAVVEGDAEGGILTDLVYKDSAKGKAFVVERMRGGVKEARLEYQPIKRCDTPKGVRTLVGVRLHTGRFHQIRVQFSHRGMSIVGDGKYGSHDNHAKGIALFSHRLSFTAEGRSYTLTAIPDLTEYPWSMFNISEEDL